jgi:hypothetical protein
MKVKNVKVAFLEESVIRSGYPHNTGEPHDFYDFEKPSKSLLVDLDGVDDAYKHIKRANKLANVPVGSGHDNFLKGIIVQFDLLYTQYWTKHLQRYTWFTYFSGQSQMHKMTVRPLKEACNKYVGKSVIEYVQRLLDFYNSEKTEYPICYDDQIIENKQKLFQVIMSNCPMGYQLWQPITTNYMSLKTIYKQRRHHKLEEWQEFCDFIETLPMAKELITIK